MKILIAEGAKTIPSCAFENCTCLSSVSIPDSVEIICDSAFEN